MCSGCGIVRPLRYALSLVRCGDGGRSKSRTLSFFERAGLRGGVGSDICMGDLRSREGGRTTLLYTSLLVGGTCSWMGLRAKRRKRDNFL
jgi:hypothetical protein